MKREICADFECPACIHLLVLTAAGGLLLEGTDEDTEAASVLSAGTNADASGNKWQGRGLDGRQFSSRIYVLSPSIATFPPVLQTRDPILILLSVDNHCPVWPNSSYVI